MRENNNIRRRSIWICDSDSMYLNMLHGYLKERIGLPLHFADFTDAKYCQEISENEDVLLLIISEEFYPSIDPSEYKDILILSEDADDFHKEGESQVCKISKYSKAAKILDAVLAILAESKQMKEVCLTSKLPVHIIGFYSPLGRCLQTATAFAMGEILAEKEKTLYLNFSPFPEQSLVNLGHGESVADLLYYYGCNPESLSMKLCQVLADVGGLKVIPPASSYMQIADVSENEWLSFIREICKASACKYLVLDLSEAMPCLFELLSLCEKIYTICGHDQSDAAKLDSYRRYLNMRHQDDLLAKTVFMQLPKGIRAAERLTTMADSELGDFLQRAGWMPGNDAAKKEYENSPVLYEVNEAAADFDDDEYEEEIKKSKRKFSLNRRFKKRRNKLFVHDNYD